MNDKWTAGDPYAFEGLSANPTYKVPILSADGQVAIVTGHAPAVTDNAALIASAPDMERTIATLRALLKEAYERLGAITELAYKSGADDLRSRIRAALEDTP